MKRTSDDWCDEELESTLIEAILLTPFPLCIFLDGLDEIDRHDEKGCDDVVRLVKSLLNRTDVKLCISSRPEKALESSFNEYPMLRLQDLAAADIASYAQDFLQDHFNYLDTTRKSARYRRDIIDAIITKASGVFLWVYLVLNNLHRGNQHRDSYELLLKRIDQCPAELDALYQQTWDRHGQDADLYRTEAARYFKLVIEAGQLQEHSIMSFSFSLLEFAVASKAEVQKRILEKGYLPPAKSLAEIAEEFGRRVEVCCGGLLEVQTHGTMRAKRGFDSAQFVDNTLRNILNQFIVPLSAYVSATPDPKSIPNGGDIARLWRAGYHQRLDFIHRTAADFLLQTRWGTELLGCESGNPADARLTLYRAQLVQVLLFGTPLHERIFSRRSLCDSFRIFEDLQPEPVAAEWQQAKAL
jgi:hypothetical protein